MRVLVTGAAGFIGFHATKRLLQRGDEVYGIDNLSAYYDVKLKEARLRILLEQQRFTFERVDVADRVATEAVFEKTRPDMVLHLAAQAGVRYSVTNPHEYVSSNLVGFLHVLEGCRHGQVRHLVFASSSSVYGANVKMPFSVHENVDHPLSLYAATKKSNELMAHSYAHLYQLPVTGLRFFTVYGPWGRPDMSPMIFAEAILDGRPIQVFNYGEMERDYTYIDDIVQGIVLALDRPAERDRQWDALRPDPASSAAPYRIYNIGASQPTNILRFVEAMEAAIGTEARKEFLPIQAGDVQSTWADVDDLRRDTGYAPRTSLECGVRNFIEWYRSYYER
ncbi:MAG: NAD-dependent epimerase [Candidatus Omnitrophota bacterium]|jgi:UDP-glucuronate 4-epimerase